MVRRGVLLLLVLTAAACGAGDFDPQSTLKTVRILGARADKPYAKPGEDVEVEVLAFDGRVAKTAPMKVSWIPFVCENPVNDLYYACFATLAGGAGPPSAANPGAGAIAALLKPGVDLTPLLPSGPKYRFTMPADAVRAHPPSPGATAPYGLTVLFNVACAGHVEITERDPKNPVSPPLGCFDDAGHQLGPDDYAIGFQRVYAYDQRTNQNPVIARVLADGTPVDPRDGLTVPHCTAEKKEDCTKVKLDVDVPPDSAEANEGDVDPSGTVRHELVWASWFTTLGELAKNDNELLYEPRAGRITSDNEAELRPPPVTGEGTMFAVVHDNRGGAAWVEFPLHVR